MRLRFFALKRRVLDPAEPRSFEVLRRFRRLLAPANRERVLRAVGL